MKSYVHVPVARLAVRREERRDALRAGEEEIDVYEVRQQRDVLLVSPPPLKLS